LVGQPTIEDGGEGNQVALGALPLFGTRVHGVDTMGSEAPLERTVG
jgi:hypothetical protein